MALADNGILGSFTGKVGTVVGVRWRDKNVMRSKPKKTRHAPSEKQLAQRSKMGLVSSFLKPLRPITDRYFGQPEAGKSRADLSLSYHLTNALTGSHPDLSIDFKKVIVTKGELPGIYGAEIVAEPDGRVRLSWFDNSGYATAKPEDLLLGIVYNPQKKCFYFAPEIPRCHGGGFLLLPTGWTHDGLQLWLSFVSCDGKSVANSIYFGAIED